MNQLTLFLNNSSVKKLIATLSYTNHTFMLVGGCIRNLLAGLPITDIDIASNFTAEQNKIYLSNQNIKVVDTGLKFGTISAIIDGKIYEITTIREDFNQTGRHTNVTYIKDFMQDAQRRDFTINALYLDHKNLKIIDYFNGIKDLHAGVIKFIGNPKERIQEDNLRILRYFRFYNQFSKTVPPKALLSTIKKHSYLVNNLSQHRISKEFTKILQHHQNLQNTLILMHNTTVLSKLLNYNKRNLVLINNVVMLTNQNKVTKLLNLIIYALILKNLNINKVFNNKHEVNAITIIINVIKREYKRKLTLNKAYKIALDYNFTTAIAYVIVIAAVKKLAVDEVNNIIGHLIKKENSSFNINGTDLTHLLADIRNTKTALNYAKYKILQNSMLSKRSILNLTKAYIARYNL